MGTVVALCLLGIGAIIGEFFVPSFGLMGLAGGGSIAGAVILAFRRFGTTVGAGLLAGVLVLVPGLVALFFRLFPRTFVGRRLILRNNQRTEDGYLSFDSARYEDLVGQEGMALTVLRPSGMVLVGEEKYSAVSPGEFIPRGTTVRVIRVEGSRIIVRQKGEKE